MGSILYPKESYDIMGAVFEVYRRKGCGFHESVYQECLEIEMGFRGIPFVAQKRIPLEYKGRVLKNTWCCDLLCFDRILIELKAVSHLADEHRAQIQNYLKAAECPLGILINFGHHPKVEYERFAHTDKLVWRFEEDTADYGNPGD